MWLWITLTVIVYFIPPLQVKQWCHFGDSRSSATRMLRFGTDRQADGLEGHCCQHPQVVRERETGAGVKAPLVSSLFKTKSACSTGLFSSEHSLALRVSSLHCAKNIMHWCCFAQFHRTRCGSLWILSSWADPPLLLISLPLCFPLTECRLLSVGYWFLFSFLSASSYSQAPVVVESSQSLATDCFPLGLSGKSKLGLLKMRRVTSSKRGCTNRCVVVFLGHS